MRLIMTLLCRNEADIVRANIEYHLAQGADFVIATDNGSTDGTVDILEEYRRAGVLRLIHEPEDDYSQARWVTRMARQAQAEHGADWVINNDADEFWWPAEGDLKTGLGALEPGAGLVVAERSNFVPRPPSPTSVAPFYERMIVRERASLNAVRAPLPPKVCHRAEPDVDVEQGNHGVSSARLGPASVRQPMLIFHFPLRSFPQFELKIQRGDAALERNTSLPRGFNITWRVLCEELRAGRLRDYYEKQVLADDVVEESIRSGELIRDTRLRDFLQARARARTATPS